MANAPLRDRMAEILKVIWVRREGKYFCKRDWTASISLIRFNKTAFCVKRRLRSRGNMPGDGFDACFCPLAA